MLAQYCLLAFPYLSNFCAFAKLYSLRSFEKVHEVVVNEGLSINTVYVEYIKHVMLANFLGCVACSYS